MADLPNPQSYEQILSDMLSSYAARLGINDFNIGAANLTFFEIVALATARASGDVFQILRDFSVDRATGDALKRLATENKVTPIAAKPATGSVTVTDSSFEKISTKIYSGANPPNIGSTSIKAANAADFTPTGSIYIGRGTPNVEGPLPYTSITPVGGYYQINLSSPTTKFHNLGETIILAQGGNRSIGANVIALSPGVGSSPDIQFSVVTAAVILDGETEVENVQVSALTPGIAGNVPAGAIKSFATPPFPGAVVTNPLPFTTGSDSETDDQLRVRIKRALASQGLGTATAVKAAVIGATPSDEQATVVSDSLVQDADGATLYIDDGTGYEAKSAGVGLEAIVDSALGGEQFFQLQTGGRQAPVAKAFLQSTLSAPFDLIGGDTLSVVVGGTTYQHVFQDTDFRSPGGVTAFEVTASINANTLLGFEATTAGGGLYVVIRSKTEGNDSLRTTVPTTSGRDASVQMGFPSNTIETLRLYKNDIPLSKDGATASLFSQAQQLWSATIQNGDTLILAVDGTGSITYTILDTDFIATGLYPSVASTNSLASWAQVLNAKLTGVTVAVVGQQLEITSNLGASNRAKVTIDPASTLVTKGMFSSLIGLSSEGKASDFTLDRNTAQFELVEPLTEGDKLTAGSTQTEAFVQSGQITGGAITFSADAHIWLLIDAAGEIVPTGVTANSNLSVSKPSANVIRYTSTIASAFGNVNVGDYVIVWSEELNAANRLEGRVYAKTSTTLDILVTASEYAAAVVEAGVLFFDGFVVLRSDFVPQKFRIQAGTKSLIDIVQELQDQTPSLFFKVILDQYLSMSSATKSSAGSILVVSSDTQGKLLDFADGSFDESKDSLVAFYDSQDQEGQLPLFIHLAFASGAVADPIDSFISSFVSSLSLAGRDPNELVCMLHPYGASRDSQPYGECVQQKSIAGATIGIEENSNIRRFRTVDRFYLANPLDFGSQDTSVVVLDADTGNKSFEIPFYRKALTNTTYVSNPTDFNAYDVESGPVAAFSSAFGTAFNFANYKVLMQAKKVLKPTPSLTAILYRSTKWGRSGEKINVGYIYPSAPNSDIGSTVLVGSTVPIRISLKSGPASANSIDGTTQWDVTITPNSPVAGVSQVTYTWNGVGTNPALTLSGGEYVNISSQTAFSAANTGIYRISDDVGFTPTATSFSVRRPNGAAVAEVNKATVVNGGISLYDNDPTSALEIKDYVNDNLSDYFSATLVNDGGTSGAGIIFRSTYEDSDFAYDSVTLKDGINWIYSNNLTGSPQFVFKNALQLPTDVGYAFNDAEEIRLIPTTMEQTKALISVLAVSGFSTIGSIDVAERAKRLELATSILGSDGSIQVIGGLANTYDTPILDSAARLDNTYMRVSVDKSSSLGIHSDQWFRLQASQVQNKAAGLSSNTSITIFGNNPTSGQSTVKLLGRDLKQRYFGKPRHNVRTRARNFKVEKQGGLVCISWDGVGSSPAFLKSPLNFNDGAGGTANITPIAGTSDAEIFIATGLANFTELSIDDLLTISGFNAANNGTFLVTGVSDDGKTVRVLNPTAFAETGTAFVAGAFTASSGVSEGDTVVFTSPFAVLNQGRFRVIRRYNNSIWIENPNVVEEEVTLPFNPISLGFDATTSFKLNAAGNTAYLNWNGVGTEPTLENAQMGDIVTFGIDFLAANRGDFMVLRSGEKLQEITQLNMPTGAQFTIGGAGKYFKIHSAGNINKYYVWFDVNNSNSDPGPVVGYTGVEVDILSGDNADTVAAKAAVVLAGLTGLGATSSASVVTVTTTGFIETDDAVNVTMPSPFSVNVVQQGRRTFLECINPSAVNESVVLVTAGVLQCHRPQMQFSEYEACVAGDKFVVSGSVLGLSNVGNYTIIRVIDRDSAIISGSLASVTNVSLNANETAVFTQEGVAYSGFKKVFLSAAEPGSPSRNSLLFDTNDQYAKIAEAAGVTMTSMSKLNFTTVIRNGLDSYRYNTGLIAEANRIIYGDPRDAVTYPGVGAAGADIFIREPLTRRVQVSIDVRINTGVPFGQTADQVRTSVSSLINSNPVGEPIAISAIISAVNAIPGVRAVAIDSPLFSPTNDLIFLSPSEKAKIIDPTLDISVNQTGT